MIPHVLACTDQNWTCGPQHTVTPVFLLVVLVAVGVFAVIGDALKRRKR